MAKRKVKNVYWQDSLGRWWTIKRNGNFWEIYMEDVSWHIKRTRTKNVALVWLTANAHKADRHGCIALDMLFN